jgi:hypothetical protein
MRPGPPMRRALAVGIAVALLFPAGTAHADRKPSDREKQKITRAFDRAGFSCDIFVEASRCTRRIRVSTVNERYAAGYISGGQFVQSGAASVRRKNHRWHVVQVGNGGGCDLPKPVMRDLRLECF